MTRKEIINRVGIEYNTENMENGEFSYQQVIKRKIKGRQHLDIRFEVDRYSLLIELKKIKSKFSHDHIKQIKEYEKLEKEYRKNNKIISILYNIETNEILVWKDGTYLEKEITINPINYYIDLYESKVNDRKKVLKAIITLNEKMHEYDIKEKNRSQFMGCILVAINNGLEFSKNLKTSEILSRIEKILKSKIDFNEDKEIKVKILIKILNLQEIINLKSEELLYILDIVENNLKPFINTKSDQGEDLLNLFFNTFNKYVGKKDKNQAFTPPHITDFMCELVDLRYNSKVLDSTCGSGSFLVQAMSKMLQKAGNDFEKRKNIKQKQLFGIEKDEIAFGLATTNMLIHEDGQSNVVCDSLFDKEDWISKIGITCVLMNPPFNGKKMPKNCPTKKGGIDKTKGFYFVERTAKAVKTGMLATILPLQCAIGGDKDIQKYKKKMLKNHTLKAVFTLPDDVFHPGANVNTCIMVFKLGVPHDKTKNTFFGYYKNDGFVKKKNLGRIENFSWEITKKNWLTTYENLDEKPNFSIKKKVSWSDEWLAEAYMETDYSLLREDSFKEAYKNYLSYIIKTKDYDD